MTIKKNLIIDKLRDKQTKLSAMVDFMAIDCNLEVTPFDIVEIPILELYNDIYWTLIENSLIDYKHGEYP